ncbi:MAG: hypothetical protein CM1200mP1_01260 [Candidatus Neomarinimicrobiota bacterium]|nr:MAG: hypothetical protein CM1200mP1_01260 [Candidatus Neomarinimicrobiota bacterium]
MLVAAKSLSEEMYPMEMVSGNLLMLVKHGNTWDLKILKGNSSNSVHPKNPDFVYFAALGHLFGPKMSVVFFEQRWGENWEKVLFINDEVGACDLLLDPNNPRIIYASTWRIKRTP